jgi:hypothetical protein
MIGSTGLSTRTVMVLYKYLSTAGLDVLESRRLKFTRPSQFNDPFDLAPALGAILPTDQLARILRETFDEEGRAWFEREMELVCTADAPGKLAGGSTYELMKEMGLDLPTLMHVVIGAMTEQWRPTFPAKFQKRISGEMGVCCFTEQPASIVMWAQYAQNCSGFVLEIDASHEFFLPRCATASWTGIAPVKYVVERPQSTLFDLTANDDDVAGKFFDEVILTKGIEWAYEREWRLNRPLSEATARQNECYYWAIDPKAITAIILGPRTPSDLENRIRHIVDSNDGFGHVRMRRAVPSWRAFELLIADSDTADGAIASEEEIQWR